MQYMARVLGLVMVVKNEAHGIEAINSVRDHIDYWTILDTGSTDGTQDLIRKTLNGVPGCLYEEPFVDFSTTYNRVFALHNKATEFALHLLGDEVVTGAKNLRDFCVQQPTGEAFLVTVQGKTSYKLARLSKTAADGWCYAGRTHEVFLKAGVLPTKTVDGCRIIRGAAPDEAARKRHRWELDRGILEEDLRRNPNDARSTFYLAQTYECLGDHTRAEQLYRKRIELSGFLEEVYESKFRLARCLEALGHPWAAVQQAYLDAYAFDPRHAEPLYQIARHWYRQENHALSYLFASLAASLTEPNVRLFIDPAVYEWEAADVAAISGYYLGKKLGNKAILSFGEQAAERAARACPAVGRLHDNHAFYVKLKDRG
jgi:tetratricopeptide (TPR) repeat protein